MATQILDTDCLLSLYRTMQVIRQTEEQLVRLHQRGLIHGACHTYVGEEAIAAGVCAHLRSDDVVFSTHRGHGHALAKGLAPEALIAELLGRATGCSRGRGGSMHLFSPEIGLMGTSGIVGPCILQAAGAGYSFRLLRRENVAVAFFGDGAVNNGAFHEGLNLASIWKLPVLFVCENNEFATEVPFKEASGIPDVGRRAANYGLHGVEVDGNDALAVYEAARDAVARARAGEGATLIECKTYRTRPHAEGMGDYTYRTREEVAAWKARCPIARLREESDHGELTASFAAVDAEVSELVAAASRAAEAAPWPDPATATAHVYCERPQSSGATAGLSSSAKTGDRQGASATDSAPPLGTREITYVEATHEALAEAMEHDRRIFVLGEGIGVRGGNFRTTAGLFERFGAERLRDTPISERGFTGLAGGAAMTGTRPIVDFMFVDFLNDAFGEVINQIAKMQYMSSGRIKMPILLRGCIGVGHSAATHHSSLLHSVYSHIPGLRVVLAATPYDAKGLFARALRSEDPVLFLEHRELMAVKGPVPEGWYEIEFGRAAVAREGTDATVVALAQMRHRALAAAESLAAEGVSIEVVDPRTVSPLDIDTILESVAKTGRLLVVDEAYGPCSVAAEIAARVADAGFDELDAPIRRLQGSFCPTPYSPPLEKVMIPQIDDIRRAIIELLAE
ncbi:MAG: dehydrogenase E1 component subunit alpha/beta [Pirellulales bacterium]|nr:dehydrogenase E1 component subunit alpha/beta [Pirellulales bacterium]